MLGEEGDVAGRDKRKPLSARLMPWQWTALELNFVLIVGIIGLINLNIWTVFHYAGQAGAPGTNALLLGVRPSFSLPPPLHRPLFGHT